MVTRRFPRIPPGHWRSAAEMRKAPTPAENALWSLLHRNRFGVRFRRQYPIGPYIVDFACMARALVIEVDGEVHDSQERTDIDAVRDAYLRERGMRILRFRNSDVLTNSHRVVELIEQALSG